ncbi:ATP-binding protein [Demequina maris]|uniref:ATP-binding protein n=1 Tax=Demequina maris TaxID=1638982 RepID=UPI000AE7B495|nr:ATP-binding protein [Demequina maris]
MTRNPYRPGVGLQPPFLAGRDQNQKDFERVLSRAPEIPGNVRMTGLRGVGKTVLLQRFAEIADEQNWATIAVELEARHCDDTAFGSLVGAKVSELETRLSRIERVKRAVSGAVHTARQAVTVSYEGFEWSAAGDLDRSTAAIADSLAAGVDASLKAGKEGLVLLFDEAQVLVDDKDASGSHALSAIVAAVSTMQKEAAPICLVLCGLPTLAVNLLGARTYTERMFQGFKIDSLKAEPAREAFTRPLRDTAISLEPRLVDRVLTEVDGYPYFIQLWGAELWDAATSADESTLTVELLDAIEEQIYERLDLDFYDPRVESLTPAEQDLLMDTEECAYPPLAVADLNAVSPKTSGNVNVLLGRLVKANVIYRQRKGEYLYTAPGFRDYLSRRKQRE